MTKPPAGLRHRGPVLSRRGLVSSAHPAVSAAGIRVLADGGNAVDAALAMAAMAFVTLPAMCGLGGDAFALYHRSAAKSYLAVHGSGFGPDGATLEFFAKRGLDAIPAEGALSVAVPGAVAALSALHELGATRPLTELWAPAVDAARAGVPVTPRTRQEILESQLLLTRDPEAARILLPDGRVPDIGHSLSFVDLAESLERLAAKPADLYRGDLAKRCLDVLRAQGAPFSGEEWASQDAPVTEPLQGSYRGRLVLETRLPSPGYMVLQQAALLDGMLSDLPWLGADAVDLFARAAHKAFADRFALVGSDGEGWRRTLDQVQVAADVEALQNRRDLPPGHPDGDTTSMVCVDVNGDAVSLIQSLAFTFGSGLVIPGTGIMLNNRTGWGAYLLRDHPNALRPRRKPMHTLNAWMIAEPDGTLAAVGNTPGGDGQVQWNMQLISHLLDHGMDPQDAVEAARFSVFPGSSAGDIGAAGELICESRLGTKVLASLNGRGHAIRSVGPWDAGGSAQIIVRLLEGCYSAGCDPRGEGCAIGI